MQQGTHTCTVCESPSLSPQLSTHPLQEDDNEFPYESGRELGEGGVQEVDYQLHHVGQTRLATRVTPTQWEMGDGGRLRYANTLFYA